MLFDRSSRLQRNRQACTFKMLPQNENLHFPAAKKVLGKINEVGTSSTVTLKGEEISFTAILEIAVTEFGTLFPRAGQIVVRLKPSEAFRSLLIAEGAADV